MARRAGRRSGAGPVIRALLAKELRALRPVMWCIWGLLACTVVVAFATELPDAKPFTPSGWLHESREGTFFVLLLFSLIIGAGLLIHESEQGTLRFLDGLPLSRTWLFVAKTMAAWLAIAWVPILGFVSDIAFGLLSRTSVDGPLPWRFAFVITGLQMVAGIYLLALSMAVSFVRGWFALVAGLIFWTYLWLQQTGAPWVIYLNPYDLLEPRLNGDHAEVWWPQAGAHLGASALLLMVAWLGFLHLGDGAQRIADWWGRNRFLRGFAATLKLLAPVVWLAAMIRLAENAGGGAHDDSSTPVGETAFARHETKRYEFLLRTQQRADAKALFDEADQIHDQVSTWLGAPPTPARIVVDLASPVISHAAGQTNWTKIRMPLQPGQELSELRQILGHETVHVFIEQFGEGRLSSHFSSIRSLHEGLATHVEFALFATEEEQAQRRRAVAGAWSRGKVPFDLLVDDSKLHEQREPTLVYPLGAELLRALIDLDGRDAPARLIRAICRPGAPAGLAGAALWRDAMQAAGLNFERLTAAYENACAEMATAEKEFTDGLPRLSAEVNVENDEIVIRPKFAGDKPGALVCLAEDDDTFGLGIKPLHKREDGAFTLSRSRHPKSKFRYLLGWKTEATAHPVFEPWGEATLP